MTKYAKENNQKPVPAFVDRIENAVAVIVLSENSEIHFNLPLQCLPPNVEEGDHLKLSFELDPESTEAARDRVAALQSELATETETHIKL